MAISFTTFNRVMASQMASKELPAISINPSSSLGMAVDRLSANIDVTDKTVQEVVSSLAKNMNDPLYRNDMATIKSVILAYANSISNSFNLLNFIKTSVGELSSKIETEVKEIASRSEVITQADLADADSYKTEFSMVPWDDAVKLGAQAFVVGQLQQSFGVFSNVSPVEVAFNNTNLTILHNSVSSYMEKKEVKSVPCSPEQFETLVTFCHDKSNITRENITRCLKIMLEKDELLKWNNMLLGKIRNPDIFSTVEAISDISTMSSVINTIEKEINSVANFNDTQAVVFNENLKLTYETLYLKYFFVCTQRAENKTRLIFDSHLLNPDAVNDFRREGFDLIDISKFIYGRLRNSQPYQGIATEAVVASINNVRDDLQRHKESVVRLANRELSDIRKRSFVRHMNAFMEQLVQEPKIGNIPMYIEHMSNDIDYLNGDLESAIYGVIINVEYPNTFVQTMYEKLGKAYMNVLSNSTKVSETDMSEAEINMVTGIIVDHIVGKLVQDVK